MKRPIIFAIALASLVLAAVQPGIAVAQSELADGEVTKIDQAAGRLTLRHGPIKKLDLDMDMGMTMVFRVQDPAMLKDLKVGDKIKFDAERINGQFTVIKIEKAK